MMKRIFLSLSLAALSLSVLLPQAVEAKRLGGGSSMGMKRTTPPRTPPANQAPAQTPTPPAAAPNTAGTPPAAATPKRSWMGPLAGLAAGLGLGALMSHMGMGAGGFGSLLTMLLVAAVAFFGIRFVMRRFMSQPAAQGMQFAGAGPRNGPDLNAAWQNPQSVDAPSQMSSNSHREALPQGAGSGAGAGLNAVGASAPALSLPAGFDAAAFERAAKLIFIRLQAANDTGDLNDLRSFTTPEMFAAVRLELQERGAQAQQTDVVKLEAEVVDLENGATQQVVSVRFHGLIREESQGAANAFDEIWHLVRPVDNSREWAIAGIAQSA